MGKEKRALLGRKIPSVTSGCGLTQGFGIKQSRNNKGEPFFGSRGKKFKQHKRKETN